MLKKKSCINTLMISSRESLVKKEKALWGGIWWWATIYVKRLCVCILHSSEKGLVRKKKIFWGVVVWWTILYIYISYFYYIFLFDKNVLLKKKRGRVVYTYYTQECLKHFIFLKEKKIFNGRIYIYTHIFVRKFLVKKKRW